MALLLLGLHLASRRRFVALVVLGAAYALTYAAPEALVVLVGIAVAVDLAGELVARRRPPLRALAAPLAGAVVGVVLGVAVHPNAANDLRLLGIVNLNIGSASFLAPVARVLRHFLQVPLLSQVPGLTTGMEFKPPSSHVLLMLFPLWGAAMVLLAGYRFGRTRPRRFTVQALALSLAWTVLFLRSERFAEYLAPFFALTLALAVDNLRRAGVHRRLAALPRRRLRVLVPVAGLVGAVVGVRLWDRAGDHLRRSGPGALPGQRPVDAQPPPRRRPGLRVVVVGDGAAHPLRSASALPGRPRPALHGRRHRGRPGAREFARVYVAIGDGHTRLADPRPGHAGQWLTLPQAMHRLFHADYVLVDQEVDQLRLSRVRADPRHFVWLREDATAALFRIRP